MTRLRLAVSAARSFLQPLALLLGVGLSAAVQAQTLEVIVTDSEGNALSEAVLELLLPEAMPKNHEPINTHIIDQIDKEFVPHVTAVVAGAEISFPNSDSILHHVYSFSAARTFNIPLYGKDENHDFFETFPVPGVVEIGCNIHDWMLAYIYVGETGHMAISGVDGRAKLEAPSAGSYQLKIWHSRLAEPGNVSLRDVVLEDGKTQVLELQFPLQRDRRIRRAPSATGTRYK